VVVVLGAGGYVAYAQASKPDSDGAYRVATASKGAVSQTLTMTGTVKRVSQVTAAFPVSGTVTGVLVKVGDTVTPGQQLATIDQTPPPGGGPPTPRRRCSRHRPS
jgi:multidrug efflux pump subunit AcrA (membrane-fusion protein)